MSSQLGGYGYRLIAPAQRLERYEFSALDPRADEVVVEVAGCGVCHTDVGFAFDGVPTRAPLPLTLGHEISGRVAAALRLTFAFPLVGFAQFLKTCRPALRLISCP